MHGYLDVRLRRIPTLISYSAPSISRRLIASEAVLLYAAMSLLKTQALVVAGAGEPFTLRDVYIDESSLDEEQALVDFKATGLCHTDVCTQDGTFPHAYPCVLGHEGAGVIRSLPKSYKGALSVGDTVLCSFDACQEHCSSCKSGNPASCHHFFTRIFWGQRMDGSTTDCYADEAKKEKVNLGFFNQSSFMRTGIVNLGSMSKVDSNLPLHLLCSFGCGVMTGFGTVLNRVLPASSEKSSKHLPDYDSLNLPEAPRIVDSVPKTIVVFGMGAVGMGAIVAAKVAKVANIIAVDLVESRLALAKEAGATHSLSAKLPLEQLVEKVKKISPDGAGANYSLEASGSPAALRSAMAVLAPRGTCAAAGVPPAGHKLELDMDQMVSGSKTYTGVLLGDANTSVLLPYMAALFKRGDFAIMEKLVTTYKPEDMSQALADSKSGKVVKPVIVW